MDSIYMVPKQKGDDVTMQFEMLDMSILLADNVELEHISKSRDQLTREENVCSNIEGHLEKSRDISEATYVEAENAVTSPTFRKRNSSITKPPSGKPVMRNESFMIFKGDTEYHSFVGVPSQTGEIPYTSFVIPSKDNQMQSQTTTNATNGSDPDLYFDLQQGCDGAIESSRNCDETEYEISMGGVLSHKEQKSRNGVTPQSSGTLRLPGIPPGNKVTLRKSSSYHQQRPPSMPASPPPEPPNNSFSWTGSRPLPPTPDLSKIQEEPRHQVVARQSSMPTEPPPLPPTLQTQMPPTQAPPLPPVTPDMVLEQPPPLLPRTTKSFAPKLPYRPPSPYLKSKPGEYPTPPITPKRVTSDDKGPTPGAPRPKPPARTPKSVEPNSGHVTGVHPIAEMLKSKKPSPLKPIMMSQTSNKTPEKTSSPPQIARKPPFIPAKPLGSRIINSSSDGGPQVKSNYKKVLLKNKSSSNDLPPKPLLPSLHPVPLRKSIETSPVMSQSKSHDVHSGKLDEELPVTSSGFPPPDVKSKEENDSSLIYSSIDESSVTSTDSGSENPGESGKKFPIPPELPTTPRNNLDANGNSPKPSPASSPAHQSMRSPKIRPKPRPTAPPPPRPPTVKQAPLEDKVPAKCPPARPPPPSLRDRNAAKLRRAASQLESERHNAASMATSTMTSPKKLLSPKKNSPKKKLESMKPKAPSSGDSNEVGMYSSIPEQSPDSVSNCSGQSENQNKDGKKQKKLNLSSIPTTMSIIKKRLRKQKYDDVTNDSKLNDETKQVFVVGNPQEEGVYAGIDEDSSNFNVNNNVYLTSQSCLIANNERQCVYAQLDHDRSSDDDVTN